MIPGIQGSTSSSLAAIASRSLTTARAWADEFSIPYAFGSYEELIASQEIDAVYIPLPNELHKPWVFAAADAGKAILCEKPLALDVSEAREMITYCRAKGVLLMEAFMWRHQPRTRGLLEKLRGGAIGDLRLVRSSFSFPIDLSDWRLDPTRGGGALWDVGCYGVSTVRLFAGGEPERIRSVARFSDRGVDLSLTAEFKFPNGVIGLIDCSFEQPFRCVYELVGSKGVIEVPDAYLPPEIPIAYLRTETGTETLVFEGGNQYGAMVDAFAKDLRGGIALSSPSEDGLAQMLALSGVLEAARSS